MGPSSDQRDERNTSDPQPGDAPGNGNGRSGQGAASAMQQLISQNREHRQHNGDADETPGQRP